MEELHDYPQNFNNQKKFQRQALTMQPQRKNKMKDFKEEIQGGKKLITTKL